MSEELPRPLPADARDAWPPFLRVFARIGLNSFGGPVAQLGVMHREAVEHQRWVSDAQFAHLLNFANLLPGPEALEVAIHLGYLRRGPLGGVAAGLLFILPGYLSMVALAWLYRDRGQLSWVGAALEGIRPAAMALIAWAAFRLARRVLQGPLAIALSAAAFAGTFFLETPFIPTLLGCGLLAALLGKRAPPRAAATAVVIAALVGATALSTAAWAAAAGTAPREPATLPAIGWVNTKAALVTFGGAYTALPYFREQMVERKGWVTDGQMLDALALGETTPGPLISVGVFLSFLAGGWSGSLVGAFFLFLPSFLLVLLLGRHLERVEGLPRSREFLLGFSAATIGLIVALAAQVAPRSVTSAFAALITVASLGALAAKVPPWWVVLVAAAAGFARGLV